MEARPLDGITIVALEQAVAAPFATRHLADLGARVIKIERPQVGDFARDYADVLRGPGRRISRCRGDSLAGGSRRIRRRGVRRAQD